MRAALPQERLVSNLPCMNPMNPDPDAGTKCRGKLFSSGKLWFTKCSTPPGSDDIGGHAEIEYIPKAMFLGCLCGLVVAIAEPGNSRSASEVAGARRTRQVAIHDSVYLSGTRCQPGQDTYAP